MRKQGFVERRMSRLSEERLVGRQKRMYSFREVLRTGIVIGFVIGTLGTGVVLGPNLGNVLKAWRNILYGTASGALAALVWSVVLRWKGRLALGWRSASQK